MLPIQVIGQQWKFTYRYPTFGGFETTELVIPDNTTIAFHVTSLDVIHSFWAYQLGVKADANPAQDNVAFTTTDATGDLHRPLLGAVRHLARGHVQLGRRGHAVSFPAVGQATRDAAGGQHQAPPALRLDLHSRRQRRRRRVTTPTTSTPTARSETYGATPPVPAPQVNVHDHTDDSDIPCSTRRGRLSMAIDTTEQPPAEYPGDDATRQHPDQAPGRSGCARTWAAAIVGGGGRLPASGTGWATSSPAGTPTSRTAARTTWPSCWPWPSACSAG